MTNEELLTRKSISVNRVCELVGVSRRTVYNWMETGKIEYILTAGGGRRIFVDTLWHAPAPVEEAAAIGRM